MITFRCRTHRDSYQQLWQVAKVDDALAGRAIEGDYKSHGLTPGGWVKEARPLLPGLYCQHCLAAGNTKPLADYDERDIGDAGLADVPHIGLGSEDFDLDDTWNRLSKRFEGLIVATRERPPRPAILDDSLRDDARLDRDVRKALHERVLRGSPLWKHQARAIDAALAGRDVVVETTTASGKSLCYWVPVLNSMVDDQWGTTLYLAPLNALVEDQLQAIERFSSAPEPGNPRPGTLPFYMREIRLGKHSVRTARYDGTIKDNDIRKQIRAARPQIVITNPEMLHQSMLPHHASAWGYLFSNLRYIVLDEMHVYKGMFGANFANILRRVLRLAEHYKQLPQIIGCSASIGNPKELYTALSGRPDPVIIAASESGAPVHRQLRAVLDIGRGDEAITTVVKDIIVTCVGEEKARTIAFMRSISEVDQVYRYVTGELGRNMKGISKKTVREYKREIPPEEKAKVTADLRNGSTLGVISTTALQLGIDVGDLSVCVVSKFPGSKASFFQQAGRVGRRGQSLVVFVADESPLDQHFVRRPPELLDAESEVVFLNPDHRETVLNHLWCADEELTLDATRDSKYWGPDTPALIAEMAKGRKTEGHDVLKVGKKGERANDVPIRSIGFECIVRDEAAKEVARPDVLRAVQRFHKYARFQIQEQSYEVTRLAINWDRRDAEATAKKLDKLDYSTTSVVKTECAITEADESLDGTDGAKLVRGPVRFTVHVDAYYKIPTGGHGEPQYQPLGPAAPPIREMDTDGLWFTAPPGWLDEIATEDRQPSVYSACQSLRIAAALLCSTDPDDIGVHIDEDPAGLSFRLFLADNIAGGNGLTEQAFRKARMLLDGALRILEDCPNCKSDPASRGCHKCVTTPWGAGTDVCRQGGITLLSKLQKSLPI